MVDRKREPLFTLKSVCHMRTGEGLLGSPLRSFSSKTASATILVFFRSLRIVGHCSQWRDCNEIVGVAKVLAKQEPFLYDRKSSTNINF